MLFLFYSLLGLVGTRMLTFHQLMKQNRYLLLLVSLILFFISSAVIADYHDQLIFFGIFFALVLIFSVYIIQHNHWLLIIGAIFAIFIVSSNYYSISSHTEINHTFMIIELSITILFFISITYITLTSILSDKIITTSTLYGAICSYLLIGLTWAFFYMLITQVNPQAFSFPSTINLSDTDQRFQNFIYYSFVTLSTLGYGDITPLSFVAKTCAWLQSVIGQIYLTVWIARLVGLSIAHKDLPKTGVNNDKE